MATARRHIIRPPVNSTPINLQTRRNVLKLRSRLDSERVALARWQTRLKRAFNAVQKHQAAILRLERQIAKSEEH